MILITTDEQIRCHLPNIVQTVKGETPFIQRLETFINLAEDWVCANITGRLVFETISHLTDRNPLRLVASRLVVAESFRRAIPSLDVVLTPNGFGIVSSSNIAPASKPRIDRLVQSMLTHRDDCIDSLLRHLTASDDWLASDRGKFFASTLFPDLRIVDVLSEAQGSRWKRYLELQPRIVDLEFSLAEEWFSFDLMSRLRKDNVRGKLSSVDKSLVMQIQAQIVEWMKSGSLNSRRLADIVDFIRRHPKAFPEWHKSETALLFSPPVFRNQRNSSGYFF